MGNAGVRYGDGQGLTSVLCRDPVGGQVRGFWKHRCYLAHRKPEGQGLSYLRSQRQMPFAEMN